MQLMSVYNPEGLQGRCDEKCYNATSTRCVCICGGVNHGVGLDKAIENTRDIALDKIFETAKSQGITGSLRIFKSHIQMELFP